MIVLCLVLKYNYNSYFAYGVDQRMQMIALTCLISPMLLPETTTLAPKETRLHSVRAFCQAVLID